MFQMSWVNILYLYRGMSRYSEVGLMIPFLYRLFDRLFTSKLMQTRGRPRTFCLGGFFCLRRIGFNREGRPTSLVLTLMPLVSNLANTKWCKQIEKWLKPWHMGTYLRVLSESCPMNTNMTGFRWFSKIFASLCFGRKWPQHWKG